MDKKRIIGQSLHSGFFFGVNFVARFLMAIALGKSLAVSDYGIYILIATMVVMITSILPLDACQYYMREVPGRPPLQAAMLFKSIVGVQTALLTALVVPFLCAPWPRAWLAQRLGLSNMPGVLFLGGVLVITESLVTELVRYLYAKREIEVGNIVLFFQTSLGGLLAFCFFLWGRGRLTLPLVLGLWFFSSCTALLFGLLSASPVDLWKAPFDPKAYPAALRFGIPLLAARLGSSLDWILRFLLAAFYSTQVVGAYTYHYNIILLVGTVTAPFISGPLEPHVIAAYNIGQTERSSLLLSVALRYRLLFILPILVGIALWGEKLVGVMAHADYVLTGNLLFLLVPIPIIGAATNTFERVLYLQKRTGVIARCYGISFAVQLLLYLVLIPIHPYHGTAIATVIGASTLAFLFWVYSRSSNVPIAIHPAQIATAGIPCLAAGWAFGRIAPRLPHLWFLGLGGFTLAVVYLACIWKFGLIRPEELRLLREMLPGLGKRAGVAR